MFFEQAREQAEREFKTNNKDAMVRVAAPGGRQGSPELPPLGARAAAWLSAPPLCNASSVHSGTMLVAGGRGFRVHTHAAAQAAQTHSAGASPPGLLSAHLPALAGVQALTKWGGALLELAHFRQGGEAYEMIEEAIAKFEQVGGRGAWAGDGRPCLPRLETGGHATSPALPQPGAVPAPALVLRGAGSGD